MLSATNEERREAEEPTLHQAENIPLYEMGNEDRAAAIIKMLKTKIPAALRTRLNESW